jgi:hypothetical protein
VLSVNHLSRSIFQTLAYFDIADFPLTQEELYHYLWQPPSLTYEEFVQQLSNLLPFFPTVTTRWGYYFLAGRENIVERRRQSVVPTDLKLYKARRIMNYIAWVPFLKAVFISSSVAAQTAHEHSDIDFFIITNPQHIWLVRFMTNLILRLGGLRIYGKNKKDRICLCFFIDSEHHDLSSWRTHYDDIHFAYWLHQMAPLYDPENEYEKFVAANIWTRELLPYIYTPSVSPEFTKEKRRMLKTISEKFLHGSLGNLGEKLTQKIQWLKLKSSLKEKAAQNNKEVVITAGVLKFHEHDTRVKYRKKWLDRISTFSE